MPYTLSYRTSVGALTLPAHDADEALEKAHALAAEGFRAVEIIDAQGRRHEAEEFERTIHGSDAPATVH